MIGKIQDGFTEWRSGWQDKESFGQVNPDRIKRVLGRLSWKSRKYARWAAAIPAYENGVKEAPGAYIKINAVKTLL